MLTVIQYLAKNMIDEIKSKQNIFTRSNRRNALKIIQDAIDRNSSDEFLINTINAQLAFILSQGHTTNSHFVSEVKHFNLLLDALKKEEPIDEVVKVMANKSIDEIQKNQNNRTNVSRIEAIKKFKSVVLKPIVSKDEIINSANEESRFVKLTGFFGIFGYKGSSFLNTMNKFISNVRDFEMIHRFNKDEALLAQERQRRIDGEIKGEPKEERREQLSQIQTSHRKPETPLMQEIEQKAKRVERKGDVIDFTSRLLPKVEDKKEDPWDIKEKNQKFNEKRVLLEEEISTLMHQNFDKTKDYENVATAWDNQCKKYDLDKWNSFKEYFPILNDTNSEVAYEYGETLLEKDSADKDKMDKIKLYSELKEKLIAFKEIFTNKDYLDYWRDLEEERNYLEQERNYLEQERSRLELEQKISRLLHEAFDKTRYCKVPVDWDNRCNRLESPDSGAFFENNSCILNYARKGEDSGRYGFTLFNQHFMSPPKIDIEIKNHHDILGAISEYDKIVTDKAYLEYRISKL